MNGLLLPGRDFTNFSKNVLVVEIGDMYLNKLVVFWWNFSNESDYSQYLQLEEDKLGFKIDVVNEEKRSHCCAITGRVK